MIAFPKQWQMLHDVAPGVRRAGMLINAANRPSADRAAAFEAFAEERAKADAALVGMESIRMRVDTLNDIEARFAELARTGAAGVLVVNDALFITPEWRPAILELALKYRLPTSCAQVRDWALSGCLVTYTEDWSAIGRGTAGQVIKVLRGTAPADIAVEQPTDYKLVINAATAKALDLTIPQTLLAAADEVIE